MCKVGGIRCPGAIRRQYEAALASGKEWRIKKAEAQWYKTKVGNAELAEKDPLGARLARIDLENPVDRIDYLINNDDYDNLVAKRDEARNNYLKMKEIDRTNMEMEDKLQLDAEMREAKFQEIEAKYNLQKYQEKVMEEVEKSVKPFDREYDKETLNGLVKIAEYDSGTKEWLQARQGVGDEVRVGGSDIGSILKLDKEFGRDNYLEVLESKISEYTEDQEQSFYQKKGDIWEPYIANKFAERHQDFDIVHSKATWAHPDNPENTANFDGLLASKKDGEVDGILEIKTGSDMSKWIDPETGLHKVPDGYRAQVLWYLHNTKLDYAYLAAYIDDRDYLEFYIERGEAIREQSQANKEKQEEARLNGKRIPASDAVGTIEEIMPKIDKFKEEVRNKRNGIDPPKRNFNYHPDATPERNLESQIAFYHDRKEDEVRRSVLNRIAKMAEIPVKSDKDLNKIDSATIDLFYDKAIKEEIKSHPFSPEGKFVVDFETTGLHPHTGAEVIEIGWQKLGANGEAVDSGFLLFKPDDRYMAANGTGAEEVHGITVNDVKDKPMFNSPEVKKQMLDMFGNDAVIIAHNTAMEKRFFDQDVRGNNFKYLDTMILSKFFTQSENNKLQGFAENFGIEYKDAHRALPDVDMTRRAINKFSQSMTGSKQNS